MTRPLVLFTVFIIKLTRTVEYFNRTRHLEKPQCSGAQNLVKLEIALRMHADSGELRRIR